jgi:protein SCO1/2
MRSPDPENKANYSIDHSSTVTVIDPNAHLHAIFTPPHKPETLIADFVKIREHYELTNKFK